MADISAKIVNAKINKAIFDIASVVKGTNDITADGSADLLTPANKTDKTALYKITLNFKIAGNDKFSIIINAEYVFEFSEVPGNYSETGDKVCLPLAQQEILKFINLTLANMGFSSPNMELNNTIWE